jgi:PTS system nitrogen regulatory IIA component
MDIGRLLDRDGVVARASAGSKRQALHLLAEAAGRKLGIDPDRVYEALLAREAAGSTGVGQGVAVPHARLPVEEMTGVFLRLEHPVDFDAVDERPVDLIFALFAPQDATVEHLRALAKVSRLLRQGELREQLRKARTEDAVYALLAREAAPNAA